MWQKGTITRDNSKDQSHTNNCHPGGVDMSGFFWSGMKFDRKNSSKNVNRNFNFYQQFITNQSEEPTNFSTLHGGYWTVVSSEDIPWYLTVFG